ncbi:MAG: hypothetical protein JRF64_05990 [Deltaproteobacteria bacterium]|nr:hypothetical protein [Deltaproteobacteria bacterium]
MTNRPTRFRNVCWALAITAILLLGCAGTSPPVTFYTLNSLSGMEPDNPEYVALTGPRLSPGGGKAGLRYPSFIDGVALC